MQQSMKDKKVANITLASLTIGSHMPRGTQETNVPKSTKNRKSTASTKFQMPSIATTLLTTRKPSIRQPASSSTSMMSLKSATQTVKTTGSRVAKRTNHKTTDENRKDSRSLSKGATHLKLISQESNGSQVASQYYTRPQKTTSSNVSGIGQHPNPYQRPPQQHSSFTGSAVVLHSDNVNAEVKKSLLSNNESDDDDDDFDCLVANETLQISAKKQSRRLTQPSAEIRKTKRRGNEIFTATSNRQNNPQPLQRNRGNVKKAGVDVNRVDKMSQSKKNVSKQENQFLKDVTNKNGLLSRNSPVQDEMTVNMAIRGSTKASSLRATKKDSQIKVFTKPMNKENNSASIHTTQSEQDQTVIVSGGPVLLDSTILKSVEQNSQVNLPETVMAELVNNNIVDGLRTHGRNFSVNLPYASKPTLHTNMSTLSKQSSQKASCSTTKPSQPRAMKRASTISTSQITLQPTTTQQPSTLKVYGQPISADHASLAAVQNQRHSHQASQNEQQSQSQMSISEATTTQFQQVVAHLHRQESCENANTLLGGDREDLLDQSEEDSSSLLHGPTVVMEHNLMVPYNIAGTDQASSSVGNTLGYILTHQESSNHQNPFVEQQQNVGSNHCMGAEEKDKQEHQKYYNYYEDEPVTISKDDQYTAKQEDETALIDFYNINCPENISEEEEPELGLGELLEEHRAHFFMEKLSGNFSTNEIQDDSTQQVNQDKGGQWSTSDQPMQSSGNMSLSLNGGNDRLQGLGCNSTSLIMRSEEGHSYGADDSKMKSQEGCGLTADEQLNDMSGQDESSSYPQVRADTRSDFQKANDVVEQASTVAADEEAAAELEKYHHQNLNDALLAIEDDNGILHADAEDDLRMIQEQLRQFNDVSINERQSIIKDHLEASANRLEQQNSLQKESETTLTFNSQSQDQRYNHGQEVDQIEQRFNEVMNLTSDPQLDQAMSNKVQSQCKDLDYTKGLLEPELKIQDIQCGFEQQQQQQLCAPAELEASSSSQNTMRAMDNEFQSVRFETSQKHQRAVTKQIGISSDQVNGRGMLFLHQQKLSKPKPPRVFVPMSNEELKIQKHDFDQDFYEKMVCKEFDARLRMDYFTWQTKIDKLMRVTLICWMAELCSDMRFQKTTFYMALTYIDKFFEQVQCLYGPEDLQLIGVTAVFVAAKVEEVFVPTVKIFSKSTNYSSSVRRICQMERDMMSTLSFRLHPVTLISWADWFTKQWDDYADSANMHSLTEVHDCAFRQFTLHSYNRYRTFMTYLDAVAIDYRAHEFQPRQLVAALLYLVIGNQQTMAVFPNYYQMAVQFTVNPPIPAPEQTDIANGPGEEDTDHFVTPGTGGKRRRCQVVLEPKKTADNGQSAENNAAAEAISDPQTVYYNEKVFGPFLSLKFNMRLEEIREAVMYVAKFLALNLELDPPDCSGLGEDPEDVKIEEYIGLQTANSNMLNYLDWIVKHEEQQRRSQNVQETTTTPTSGTHQRRGRKVEAKGSSQTGGSRRTTTNGQLIKN